MKLLKSKKDVKEEDFLNTKKRPEKFPCIIYNQYEEGGIGGSYEYTYIHYIPKNIKCLDSYLAGFNNGVN